MADWAPLQRGSAVLCGSGVVTEIRGQGGAGCRPVGSGGDPRIGPWRRVALGRGNSMMSPQ